jgi:small subunit ribosomal protein S4e
MSRGAKKHLKRLNAPKHWMLNKMGGIFAPKPAAGPHKSRECLPLSIILRNRLKYALTRKEAMMIVMQKSIKVDGKVRTELNYPAGIMGTSHYTTTPGCLRAACAQWLQSVDEL